MIRISPARALVAVAYMCGVIYLSSLPGQTIARWPLIPTLGDLAHVPLFMGLAWATLWAVQAPSPLYRAALVFGMCTAFAATDELHQRFVPGRDASWNDLAADVLGISIALTIWAATRPMLAALKGEDG